MTELTTTGKPSKLLLISAASAPATTMALYGIPLPVVIDFEGEPHEVQVSPYVPAGQAYVIDQAAIQDHLDASLNSPPRWRP